jgi:4-hydroxythreonine-4-phosphate dehydrogenase
MTGRPVRIAITLGDPGGVGPEVALKALRVVGPVPGVSFQLVGDPAVAAAINNRLSLGLAWSHDREGVPLSFLSPPAPETAALPQGHPDAARAALVWLTTAARGAKEGRFDAIVTGPVNKASILRTGADFIGQTEWVAAIAGCSRFAMMLLGPDHAGAWLRVALATTHLPIAKVPAALGIDGVATTIGLASEACARLRLPRRRVGVCGLNPHAGEEGHLGREDIDIVAPAVLAARALGADAVGPLPADTLFHQAYRGEFDAVVAMYHDQGLPPLKMVAFDRGVNWTLGLPFPRLSPDHGTAYDIAGRGLARPESTIEAIRIAVALAQGTAPVA